ncbi:HEAT repeat domain-containing protein, partial [Streptomyces scabiei]|uniref:HEAT repeat domain-containing protein n=1 Tax=Streptomyces scabiei TaxID=1930 RepID=UPI0029A1825A
VAVLTETLPPGTGRALAEEQPELAALQPYLADPAPAVRREAVAVLTETLPPGTGRALAGALRDGAAEVRAAAAASLRELVETLPPEPALRDGLAAALAEPDPVVRAVALDVLRALSLGDTALYAASLTDSDIAVRIEAVRALVSVDAAAELAGAATTDPSREVRVTIAKALATVAADAAHPLPPARLLYT